MEGVTGSIRVAPTIFLSHLVLLFRVADEEEILLSGAANLQRDKQSVMRPFGGREPRQFRPQLFGHCFDEPRTKPLACPRVEIAGQSNTLVADR